MGFKSFLKGFLWFNNMVLLLLGAAVALYAAVLLSEFDKERRGGSEDTPAAPPPPLAPGSDAPSYVDHVVADEPWFLYALAGAGVYVALCAAVGMCGAECGAGACNALCLNAYSWTMALALLGQTALAVAVFVVPTGYLRAPNDITGAESRAWRLIHKNLVVVKWFAIALLVLQVTSVSAAMILKRIARAKRRRRDSRLEHDDEYDSSEDEYEWEDESSSYYSRRGRVGTRTRRPLLFPFLRGGADGTDGADTDGGMTGATTEDESLEGGYGLGRGGYHDPFSPGRGDSVPTSPATPWSQRMKEKYGLDTARFTYDENDPTPATSRRGNVGGGSSGEGGGGCVVM